MKDTRLIRVLDYLIKVEEDSNEDSLEVRMDEQLDAGKINQKDCDLIINFISSDRKMVSEQLKKSADKLDYLYLHALILKVELKD